MALTTPTTLLPPIQPPPKRIFGLNKNIFMLGLTSFFNDFSNQMILAAFPAFFASVLKSGAASLGLVEGLADGAANFFKIYSGALSDKMRKQRIFIFIGYSLSVIVRPFYILTGSVGAVLGLRVTDRIGKGLRESPRDVIISASAGEHEQGRSFGYHRAMDTAGGVLGPLAAYLILSRWPGGFNIIFITAFLLGLIAVATIFFVKDIVVRKDDRGRKVLSLSSYFRMPLNLRLYLAAIFFLSVGSIPIAVLLLKTTTIGLFIASIPLFYMVYSIAYSGFSYISGKLSDSFGTVKVLVVGYIILLVAYLGINYAQGALALVLAFIVLGVFSAATDSTARAFIGRTIPLEEKGTAYGLFNASTGFGAMFAGIVGGYVWQAYSPSVALFLAAVVVVFGLVVLIYSISRKPKGL